MTPAIDDGDVRIYQGDVLDVLRGLPDSSVDCCVTSPPYYGLRDYGVDGQIGLEDTPEAFIERLVAVFAEVRRVLADHGTCWVNMGDSYAANRTYQVSQTKHLVHDYGESNATRVPDGLKPKDLLMMPARVALALQADGWWLRSDVIWAKPNPMPESVRDRPTSAHEHIFLLTKAPRYYWDAEGVREPSVIGEGAVRNIAPANKGTATTRNDGDRVGVVNNGYRNVRNVWTIATEPTPEAHFATFPTELVRRCLAAGCPELVCGTCGAPSERVVERVPTGEFHKAPDGWDTGGGGHGTIHRNGRQRGEVGIPVTRPETTGWTDCGHGAYRPGVVLDPFMGSGTTALVARRMGLRSVGIELNPDYVEIAARRLQQLSLLGGAA